MRSRMAEKNQNLPEDLVMEGILPKLPVKSLVRFRSVSKSWKALFKTPSFASKQLSASSLKHKHNPLLLFSRIENRYPFSHCFKLHSNGNPSPDLYKPFADDDVHRVYGPCNGIFCIHCRDLDLIIWNPATREVKLPPPPMCLPSNEHDIPVYGFGVDPKTNDYKIVKLLFIERYYTNREELAIAEVYNLTTDSWRIINDIVPACYIYPVECNSYANGLHCWVADNGYGSVRRILCFDMSSETFQEIKVPLNGISLNDDAYNGDGIAVINNCISYFCLYKNNHGILLEVAVMDEYGGAETSWTNSSYNLNLGSLFHCFWKDGEIILSAREQEFLTSYKTEDSELRPVEEIQIKSNDFCCCLFEYIESIVPLTI